MPVRYRAVPPKRVTVEPAPKEVEAPKVVEVDPSSLKKDDLVALAEERGIDSSGTKSDILERLT